jgi:hypothetical protein
MLATAGQREDRLAAHFPKRRFWAKAAEKLLPLTTPNREKLSTSRNYQVGSPISREHADLTIRRLRQAVSANRGSAVPSEDTKKTPPPRGPGVVAGAGFEPATFGL